MSGLNKIEAEKVISKLDEDQRVDLLMYLAEMFDSRVISEKGYDATYFISRGDEEDDDDDK